MGPIKRKGPAKPANSFSYFIKSVRDAQKKNNPEVQMDFANLSRQCGIVWRGLDGNAKADFQEMAAKDRERYRIEMKKFSLEGNEAVEDKMADSGNEAVEDKMADSGDEAVDDKMADSGNEAVDDKMADSGNEAVEDEMAESGNETVEDKMADSGKVTGKKTDSPRRFLTSFFWFSHDERSNVMKKYPFYTQAEVVTELASMWTALDPETKKQYQYLAKKDVERYCKEMKEYKEANAE